MQTRKRKVENNNNVTVRKSRKQQQYCLSDFPYEIRLAILSFVPFPEYPVLRYVCQWMRDTIKIEVVPQLGKVFHVEENRGWVLYPGIVYDHYTQYKSETLWESILKNFEKYGCGDIQEIHVAHATAKGCVSTRKHLKLAQDLFLGMTNGVTFKHLVLRGGSPKLYPYMKQIMKEEKKRLVNCMDVLEPLCIGGNVEAVKQWIIQSKGYYKVTQALSNAIYYKNMASAITIYNHATYLGENNSMILRKNHNLIYDTIATINDLGIMKLTYYMVINLVNAFSKNMGLSIVNQPKNVPFHRKDGTMFTEPYITLENYKDIIANLPDTAYEMDVDTGTVSAEDPMFHNVLYLETLVKKDHHRIRIKKNAAHFLFDRPIISENVPIFISLLSGIEILKSYCWELFYYLWEKGCYPDVRKSYVKQMIYFGMHELLKLIGNGITTLADKLDYYKQQALVPIWVPKELFKWLIDNGHGEFALWMYELWSIPLREARKEELEEILSIIKLMHEYGKTVGQDVLRPELHMTAIEYDSPELYDYLIENGIELRKDVWEVLSDIVYDKNIKARWRHGTWRFPGRWCANIYAKHGGDELERVVVQMKIASTTNLLKESMDKIKQRSEMEVAAKKYNVPHDILFGECMHSDYELINLPLYLD